MSRHGNVVGALVSTRNTGASVGFVTVGPGVAGRLDGLPAGWNLPQTLAGNRSTGVLSPARRGRPPRRLATPERLPETPRRERCGLLSRLCDVHGLARSRADRRGCARIVTAVVGRRLAGHGTSLAGHGMRAARRNGAARNRLDGPVRILLRAVLGLLRAGSGGRRCVWRRLRARSLGSLGWHERRAGPERRCRASRRCRSGGARRWRERRPRRRQRNAGRRRQAVRDRSAAVPRARVAVAVAARGVDGWEAALVGVPAAAVGRAHQHLRHPPRAESHHLGVPHQRRVHPADRGLLLLGGLHRRGGFGGRDRVVVLVGHRRVVGVDVLVGLALDRHGHPVRRPEAGQATGLPGVLRAGRRLHRIMTPVERRRCPHRPEHGGRAVGRVHPGQVQRPTTVPVPGRPAHPLCVPGARIVSAVHRPRHPRGRVRENLCCARTRSREIRS
jgi:hypothetical protein